MRMTMVDRDALERLVVQLRSLSDLVSVDQAASDDHTEQAVAETERLIAALGVKGL